MEIRRNADGQQNLSDLRKALEASETIADVYKMGGNWVISEVSGRTKTCPYHWTERQALQSALFGEIETKDETQYHAGK